MTSLGDLVERVLKATGPDRELDFCLHIELVEDEIWPATDMRGRITNPNARMSDYLAAYRDVINADDQDFIFPRYTASLDAALALCERVLPGWWWNVCVRPGRAYVFYGGNCTVENEGPELPTPALALLAALLRAKIAEQEERGS